MHLARYAHSVTVVVRRPDLSSTMSSYLVAEIRHNPRITVLGRTEITDAAEQPVVTVSSTIVVRGDGA